MNLFSKKSKPDSPRQMVTDTSGLIDGRIVPIAKAGFVPQLIIVPRFVVAELQFLADNGDSQKRERARFGLDVIRELQELRVVEVAIARDDYAKIAEVDDKLIAIAKAYGAMLYTTDYNLNKVAQIEGVAVLNVNELAHALRPPLLPGEKVEIKITQIGQDKTQGVGYLEDGTMVVVERAASKLGQRLVVVCSRMIQTQAGKMMFAVLPSQATGVGRKTGFGEQHDDTKPVQPQVSSQNVQRTEHATATTPPSIQGVQKHKTATASSVTNTTGQPAQQATDTGRATRPANPLSKPRQQQRGQSQNSRGSSRPARGNGKQRSGRVDVEDRLMRALQG